MSQTSRHPTPPGNRAHSGRRRAATAFVAALGVACAALCGPAAAFADDDVPTPAPTQTTEQPVASLHAETGTAGTMRAGDALRVSATVDNPTGTELAAGTAHVSVGTGTLDAAAIDAWLRGDSSDHTFTTLTPTTTDPVAPGASATLSLTTAATDDTVAALGPGTHPVLVSYTAGDVTLSSREIVTIAADDADDVDTTVIVPVTTGASTDGLLSADTLTTLTSPGGALAELVEGVRGAPHALLAIDPAIVVSIRVLGSSTPPVAREWLQTLMSLPNERVALQFADADVTPQFAAGLEQPLAPTSFSWALLEENFAPEDAPTDAPTPVPSGTASDADATEVVFPTTEQLGDVRADITAWWPVEGRTTQQTVDLAGTGTVLVLSSDATGTNAGHVTIGKTDVLSYDTDASGALSSAAAETDAAARADQLARLNATIAADADENLVIALDREVTYDADALHDALAAVSSGALTAAVSATTQLGSDAVSATFAATDADEVQTNAVTQILADEDRLTAFATVLDSPELLLGRERARDLRVLSVAWTGSDDAAAVVSDRNDAVTAILQSVELVQPTQITQVSSGSNIPMFVRNDLPFDVTVVVITTSDDVRLQVQERTEIAAPASSTTRVSIPVTARISNGEVRISLVLQSLDGVTIGSEKYADVTIRAEWEGIGIGVFAAMVVLLVVFGAFRMIRRRRNGTDDSTAKRPSRAEARAAYRAPNEENDERG